jgi:hypothetical protein
LSRISYGAQELAVFLLADSPSNFKEIQVRKENKVFSFPHNTGEENEERPSMSIPDG